MKSKITYPAIALIIIAFATTFSICSKKEKIETIKVSYYGTKAKTESHDKKWFIVETFRTSALNDSTIGQKSYLMLLSKKDYDGVVGKFNDDPRIFSVCKTMLITRIQDTVYSPFIIDGTNEPLYIVGQLYEYGKEITTGAIVGVDNGHPIGWTTVRIQTLDKKINVVVQTETLIFTNIGCFMIGYNKERFFNYYSKKIPVVQQAEFSGYPQGWFGGF